MTTIVNNPAPAPAADSGGNGLVIGGIVLIAFVVILLFFGIPAIKRMVPAQVNIPAPQVIIPDRIDVNVNQAK